MRTTDRDTWARVSKITHTIKVLDDRAEAYSRRYRDRREGLLKRKEDLYTQLRNRSRRKSIDEHSVVNTEEE